MPDRYFTKTGQTIEIGRKVGGGGEGTIYSVRGSSSVAKIYSRQTTRLAEQKLTAMVTNPPPTTDADGNVALTWPKDILYTDDRHLAGFTMPEVDTTVYRPIFQYWNASSRRLLHDVPKDQSDVDRLLQTIGANFLTIVSSIHQLAYIIGDINESNILARVDGPIVILDTDSFQVYDQNNHVIHRCPVGKPEYTDPILVAMFGQPCSDSACSIRRPHRKAFQCVDRTLGHDNFAIAVVLFKLLMNGIHPFDGPDGSYQDKITKRLFPYGARSLKCPQHATDRWLKLSSDWQKYFESTFTTNRRYSAEEVRKLGDPLSDNLGHQRTLDPIAPQPQRPTGSSTTIGTGGTAVPTSGGTSTAVRTPPRTPSPARMPATAAGTSPPAPTPEKMTSLSILAGCLMGLGLFVGWVPAMMSASLIAGEHPWYPSRGATASDWVIIGVLWALPIVISGLLLGFTRSRTSWKGVVWSGLLGIPAFIVLLYLEFAFFPVDNPALAMGNSAPAVVAPPRPTPTPVPKVSAGPLAAPVPPPSVPCANGVAVPGFAEGLVGDCQTLLSMKKALGGDDILDWSPDMYIYNWQGVKIAGYPAQVIALDLAGMGLTGHIPPELADLGKLVSLNLSDNQLTGGIPPELGKLKGLHTLFLNNNRLTGDIPRDLALLANLRHVALSQSGLTGTGSMESKTLTPSTPGPAETPRPAAAPTAVPSPPQPVLFLRNLVDRDGDEFRYPKAIAVDRFQNVYIGERRRVHVFDSDGLLLRDWGISGGGDGEFADLSGIAVGPNGHVYVTDEYLHRVQVFDADGKYLQGWGYLGNEDGEFNSPDGIAVDGNSNVYVADHDRVQVFDADAQFLYELGSEGLGYAFEYPEGIAIDGSGKIYVADIGNDRVRVFNADGSFLRDVGSEGRGDGEFSHLRGIAVDGSGNLYVADGGNHRVQVFDPEGRFLRKWGSEGEGEGEFSGHTGPDEIAVDGSGKIYVADSANYHGTVQVFAPVFAQTPISAPKRATPRFVFKRKWGAFGAGSRDHWFSYWFNLTVDNEGDVYVADSGLREIKVFDGEGRFLRRWRIGGRGQAEIPQSIAVDADGNVYVTDSGLHQVHVFDASGRFLLQWGSEGSGDGEFSSPEGIAIDKSGNVYVTDNENHRVQVFDSDGRFLRKWGSRGSGDGEFSTPHGIAVDDGSGKIYVADRGNQRVQVFDSDGRFLRKWASKSLGSTKRTGHHSFRGIAVDVSGNVYVADSANHRVMIIDTEGYRLLSTLGSEGKEHGQFSDRLSGLGFDGAGNLYVADGGNARIQVFEPLLPTP